MMRSSLCLCLALVVATTGCAGVLKTGIGALGDKIADGDNGGRGAPRGAIPSDAPKAVTGARGAQSRPEATVTSTYQHAPTLDWQGKSVFQPYSIFQQLSHPAGPGQPNCQTVPRGLAQVVAVPFGAPGSPLFDVGPLHFGLAGSVVPLEQVFSLNKDVVADRGLRSGGLLAGEGPACSTTLFFYMRIGGSSENPVSVLR